MDNIEFLYYLAMCFCFSFLIGIERQFRRRIIGLRTTILVSVGAFLFVSFSFIIGSVDVSRIASQVVAGIGFLGAGVILKDGKKVRGLTTAATLWCDAAIGVLCAGGAILPAAIGTLIILFSNTILRYINQLIYKTSEDKDIKITYIINITCIREDTLKIKKIINDFIDKEKNIEINNINIRDLSEASNLNIKCSVRGEKNKLNELIDKLYEKYSITNIDLRKMDETKNAELDEEI